MKGETRYGMLHFQKMHQESNKESPCEKDRKEEIIFLP
jgi:hypothetical protein